MCPKLIMRGGKGSFVEAIVDTAAGKLQSIDTTVDPKTLYHFGTQFLYQVVDEGMGNPRAYSAFYQRALELAEEKGADYILVDQPRFSRHKKSLVVGEDVLMEALVSLYLE